MLPIAWILGGAAALFLVTRKSTPAAPAGGGGVAPGAGGGATPPAPTGCSDPGVIKLPPPAPGFGTGFAALPTVPVPALGGKSYKDFIEAFMKMTPASPELGTGAMRAGFISAAAVAADGWTKSLRCSGYNDAANLMAQQALEMRQWK